MTKEKAEEISVYIRKVADWMVRNHEYIDENSLVFNCNHDPIETTEANGIPKFERGRVSYEIKVSEYDKYQCQRIQRSKQEQSK